MERARLERAIGVTRVARVTGLDRTGVEVACAVRPGGHILQVSNGKGETWETAAEGAVLEAAELWAAERVDSASLRFGSVEELRSREATVLHPVDLRERRGAAAPGLLSASARIAWRAGVDLATGEEIWVPAQAVHCPPSGAAVLGPSVVAWTSNGMGAHPSREAALLHALLETIERDALARALPAGFTPGAVAERMLDPRSLGKVAPRTEARARSIAERGFEVYLFDLSASRSGSGSRSGWGPSGLGLPVAGAILVDRERGPVPVTAGYACGLAPDDALLAALLEAAQSRLTDIHGAREDVAAADADALGGFADVCAKARPRRRASEMPRAAERRPASARSALSLVVARLRETRRRAAAVDLAPPHLGVHVAKVLVPGFVVSELL